MSPVRLALDQLLLEQKRFWRDPADVDLHRCVFPIFFLVIFGSLNANDRLKQLGNINFNQFFTPNIVAFGLMSACLVNLGINLPFRHDTGLLKRMRGTPLPIPSFVFGLLANAFLVSAILTVVVMTFGAVAYNVVFPLSHLPDLVLVLLIGAASFSALGITIASLVPNRMPGPRSSTRSSSRSCSSRGRSARRSGFGAGEDRQLLPGAPVPAGDLRDVRSLGGRVTAALGRILAVVAAWGAVASVITVRRFRWEPRVT